MDSDADSLASGRFGPWFGVPIAIIGVAGMAGWLTHSPQLLILAQGASPLAFPTSVCFVLTGLALLAHRTLIRASALLVLVTAVFPLWHLAHYFLGLRREGLEGLAHLSGIGTAMMAPNTAVCLILASIGLLALGQSRWAWLAGLSGAVVGACGVAALAGYSFDLPAAYGWAELKPMSIQAAIGLALLGAGLARSAWEADVDARQSLPRWSAVALGLTGLTLTVAMWHAFDRIQGPISRQLGRPVMGMVDEAVLLFGVVMSFALFLVMTYLGKARTAVRLARETNRKLVAEVAERLAAQRLLSDSERKFRSFFDIGLVGFVETSTDRRLVRVNDEFCRIIGLHRDQLIGRSWHDFLPTEDLPAETQLVRRMKDGQVTGHSLERRLISACGTIINVIMSTCVKWTDEGEVDYFFDVIQDISDQKALEKNLADSNERLSQFVAVASHDLQSPLRNITSFSQLLAGRYGDKFDTEAKDFLDFIVTSAGQMSQLVTDLLAYARMANGEPNLARVPARQAVDRALTNLKTQILETEAGVTISDLPVVLAEDTHLVSLFQNLLANALNYRHPNRAPSIRVDARRQGTNAWCFSVADNGIGIEESNYERVFEAFQRLAPDHGSGGSGIGLAICRTIVGRLGGEIWLESSVGKGSTFFFTIPDQEAGDPLVYQSSVA